MRYVRPTVTRERGRGQVMLRDKHFWIGLAATMAIAFLMALVIK